MAKRRKVVHPRGAGRAQLVSVEGGWDEAKQAAFLEHLALTANVSASARAVGQCERGVYKLRQRSSGFRAAWAAALREGYAKLELMLLDRAMNGTEKPVFHSGVKIDVMREYPDATALRLLAAHRDAVAEERTTPQSDPAEVCRMIEAKLAEIAARLKPDG
jgi:hypothetical protein